MPLHPAGRTDRQAAWSGAQPPAHTLAAGVPAPGWTDPDPHPYTAPGVLRGEAHSSTSHSKSIFKHSCLQIWVGSRGTSSAGRDRQTPAHPAPGQCCRARPWGCTSAASTWLLATVLLLSSFPLLSCSPFLFSTYCVSVLKTPDRKLQPIRKVIRRS